MSRSAQCLHADRARRVERFPRYCGCDNVQFCQCWRYRHFMVGNSSASSSVKQNAKLDAVPSRMDPLAFMDVPDMTLPAASDRRPPQLGTSQVIGLNTDLRAASLRHLHAHVRSTCSEGRSLSATTVVVVTLVDDCSIFETRLSHAFLEMPGRLQPGLFQQQQQQQHLQGPSHAGAYLGPSHSAV